MRSNRSSNNIIGGYRTRTCIGVTLDCLANSSDNHCGNPPMGRAGFEPAWARPTPRQTRSPLVRSGNDPRLHYAQIAHIGIEPMISTLKVWRLNRLSNAPRHQYTTHCTVCNTCINDLKSNIASNKCSIGITQEWGEKERDGRVSSLRCDSNTVLRRLFFSRIARQKPLNIAFSELKLCMPFQIRRLLHWLNLATLHKRIKCCAADMQSAQDLFCAQQFIVAHTIQKPFCTSLTKRTFLTRHLYKVYNTNIIHDQENFCNGFKRQSPSKTKKKNAGLSQRVEKILVAANSSTKLWTSGVNESCNPLPIFSISLASKGCQELYKMGMRSERRYIHE